MMERRYFEIIVKDYNLAYVCEIDEEKYNEFKNNFEYVYYTKNREKYPLDKIWSLCINILIVDDEHLYALLDDLREQGFYETEGGD